MGRPVWVGHSCPTRFQQIPCVARAPSPAKASYQGMPSKISVPPYLSIGIFPKAQSQQIQRINTKHLNATLGHPSPDNFESDSSPTASASLPVPPESPPVHPPVPRSPLHPLPLQASHLSPTFQE